MATTEKSLKSASVMELVERMRPNFEACGIVDEKKAGTNEKTGDKWFRVSCKTIGESFQYYLEREHYDMLEEGGLYKFQGRLEHDYKGNLTCKVVDIKPAD
ncbi:hypothetical protein JD969_15090 [Planctomycetota bacterium]|nr:hypothetical protein JD969_15090 [Planctomycetota bacterium]